MTRRDADRVAALAQEQLRHEGRLFEYLTEALRERIDSNQSSLEALISAAEALRVDVSIPSDWRTRRERDLEAAEEEAREVQERLAKLRAYR